MDFGIAEESHGTWGLSARAERGLGAIALWKGRVRSSWRAILAVGPALLFWTTPAAADEDWARRGWYVGIGGGAAFDFLDEYIKEQTGGLIDIGAGGSLNVRGGYRVTSWLAIEGMYEGMFDNEIRVGGIPLADTTFHSLIGNVKLFAPIWRTHPYLTIGPGAQSGSFRASGSLDRFDLDRWDFMLRIGVGLDAYLTEHWLVNLELAPSVRFKTWIEPTRATDNVSLTVSGGIQYRF